jgi:hypothetical protein
MAGLIPIDGLDQWDVLARGAPGGRSELVLDHCLENFSAAPTGCNHFGSSRPGGVGALVEVVGGSLLKLVAGPNGGEWSSFTNTTATSPFGGVACDDYCVFNLTADPSEHNDLRAAQPGVAADLLARFAALAAEYHPPAYNPPPQDAAVCAAAAAAGNFLVPWTSPAPPRPLGRCVGGPGDPGWQVLNGTGGGGPGYRHFPASGLGDEALATCRAECCADEWCVSVVLHADDGGRHTCWLNAANGTDAPYARADTLLGYVNRSAAAEA